LNYVCESRRTFLLLDRDVNIEGSGCIKVLGTCFFCRVYILYIKYVVQKYCLCMYLYVQLYMYMFFKYSIVLYIPSYNAGIV